MNPESVAKGLDELGLLRCAVYTALKPFFETRALFEAMWIWEEEYVTRNEQSLRKFVMTVCAGEMAGKSQSVYHNLMCHMFEDGIRLEEDPYRLMLAYRSGKLETQPMQSIKMSIQTEAMVVFNALLLKLNARFEHDDRYYAFKVREYVNDALADYGAGLSIEQINELRLWMKYLSGPLEYEYTAKQMSAVLHLFYVGACEYFGPSKADQYLALTINRVEELPEARKFMPAQIL